MPRLRTPDLTLQPSVVPLPAPLAEIVRASGLSRLVPDRWQPLLATHWGHGRSRAIQAADGAVLGAGARMLASRLRRDAATADLQAA